MKVLLVLVEWSVGRENSSQKARAPGHHSPNSRGLLGDKHVDSAYAPALVRTRRSRHRGIRGNAGRNSGNRCRNYPSDRFPLKQCVFQRRQFHPVTASCEAMVARSLARVIAQHSAKETA